MGRKAMTFRDWQQFSPSEAARELHHRIRTLLTPAQQRAAIAFLADEAALIEQFSNTDPSAPLGRVPYFLKDLFDLAGSPTLAGSTFLPELRSAPAKDANTGAPGGRALPRPEATIVRVLRDAGAVVVGKTHLHEFAYGITGENPHYGDCEHPHFPGRTTGGSSSGSAAVVAAGIVPFAIGTDTGGSVRVPAAFCGLFGFRLTPKDPLISGAFPLAPSFDTAGWFTSNAVDMRTAINALVGSQSDAQPPRGLYLEMPGLNADVATACFDAAMRFAPAIDPLARGELLDAFDRSAEIYNHIVAKEAWAVHCAWADRYRSRYDPAVWVRLKRIQDITPETIDRAYADLAVVRARWTEYFRSFNFLIMAATPFGALTKAECTLANRSRILPLTAPASLGGLPVLTIPIRLPSGLTTGLQIIVNHPKSHAVPWALEIASSS